jgi:hypothetical protein
MPVLPLNNPRWDDLLDDFRNSGLTHAEFCRRYSPLPIWWTRTLRLQPFAIV